MGLFRKKEVGVPKDVVEESPTDEKKESTDLSSEGKLGTEIEKLKAQLASVQEMQKVAGERFSRVGEQIGEMRAMILDRDKKGQLLEAKALQAVDLVQSVQPDKLMVEVRKMDGKIEALRASIEGNESILKNVMGEVKDMRTKMSTFRGLDEVVKLSGDIKKDLLAMKKISVDVERHADMVSSIFNESQRRFSDMEQFVESTKDLDKSFKQIVGDFETIRAKMLTLATKKSFDGLVGKFNQFEKHAGNVMLILNKKFQAVEGTLKAEFEDRIKKVEKLVRGLEELIKKTPDLNKFFQLLEEEALKAAQEEAKPSEELENPGEESDDSEDAGGDGDKKEDAKK